MTVRAAVLTLALAACGAPDSASLALSLHGMNGVDSSNVRAVRVRVFSNARAGGASVGCSDFLMGALSPYAKSLTKLAEVTHAPGDLFHLDLDPGTRLIYVEGFPNASGAGEVSAVGCSETTIMAGKRAAATVLMLRALDGDQDGHAGLIDFGTGQSTEGPDCNDADPQIHPGAEEPCGGTVDLDCDKMPPAPCPCTAAAACVMTLQCCLRASNTCGVPVNRPTDCL